MTCTVAGGWSTAWLLQTADYDRCSSFGSTSAKSKFKSSLNKSIPQWRQTARNRDMPPIDDVINLSWCPYMLICLYEEHIFHGSNLHGHASIIKHCIQDAEAFLNYTIAWAHAQYKRWQFTNVGVLLRSIYIYVQECCPTADGIYNSCRNKMQYSSALPTHFSEAQQRTLPSGGAL